MITDVLIRNFKCFKALTVPELGRITLVGGRNNVGKTALLEALFLFLDRMRPDMILRQYHWRGVDHVAVEPNVLWAPIFHNYDMGQEILISASVDGQPESAAFKFDPNFIPPAPTTGHARNEQTISTGQEPTGSFALNVEYKSGDRTIQVSHLFINSSGQQVLNIESASGHRHAAHYFPAKKHISATQTAAEFSNLARDGREDEILEFLRIIEPRLDSLRVLAEGPNPSLYGRLRGVSRALPIHLMGEGMEKLVNVILGIVHSQQGCVFIDEIENGLHHSVLPDIWVAISKALNKYECQLITSTHSYELLQSAHQGLSGNPEDFRYIRLDRKEDQVLAKLSNYAMIETALNANMEVR